MVDGTRIALQSGNTSTTYNKIGLIQQLIQKVTNDATVVTMELR